MTQEEKAKRYDKIVEMAKSWHVDAQIDFKKSLETLFPELVESEDERIRKRIIHALHGDVLDMEETAKAIAYLEKQGEQEHTDKVEPIFHKGDWVVCEVTSSVYQIEKCIENLSNHKYGYDLTNGGYIGSDEVNHYHLWTIKDAKDGDVLATVNHILIFEKILPDNGGVSYCHYDFGCSTPQFNFNKDNNWYFGKEAKVYPATKEQRDLLFQKMREAGYEWDAEKKELNEIDWNPQPGDTFRKKGTAKSPIYHLCDKLEDGIHFGFIEERENSAVGGEISIFALKNEYELVERLKPIEKVIEEEFNKITELKPSWSEEDERHLNNIIKRTVAYGDSSVYGLIKDDIGWLKSLKDRVQPQQKQEWGEEDEKYLKHAIENFQKLGNSYLTFWLKSLKTKYITLPIQKWNERDDRLLRVCVTVINGIDNFCPENKQELTDWLKSLRPQTAWKPSDEQINVLNEVLNFAANHENPHWNDYIFGTLHNLIRQLKKLREE